MEDCAVGEVFVSCERGGLDFGDLILYVLFWSQKVGFSTNWGVGSLAR